MLSTEKVNRYVGMTASILNENVHILGMKRKNIVDFVIANIKNNDRGYMSTYNPLIRTIVSIVLESRRTKDESLIGLINMICDGKIYHMIAYDFITATKNDLRSRSIIMAMDEVKRSESMMEFISKSGCWKDTNAIIDMANTLQFPEIPHTEEHILQNTIAIASRLTKDEIMELGATHIIAKHLGLRFKRKELHQAIPRVVSIMRRIRSSSKNMPLMNLLDLMYEGKLSVITGYYFTIATDFDINTRNELMNSRDLAGIHNYVTNFRYHPSEYNKLYTQLKNGINTNVGRCNTTEKIKEYYKALNAISHRPMTPLKDATEPQSNVVLKSESVNPRDNLNVPDILEVNLKLDPRSLEILAQIYKTSIWNCNSLNDEEEVAGFFDKHFAQIDPRFTKTKTHGIDLSKINA
jgi:hypothetical protein